METRQKIQLDTLDLHSLVRVNLEKVYLDNKYEEPRGIEWEFSYENISKLTEQVVSFMCETYEDNHGEYLTWRKNKGLDFYKVFYSYLYGSEE